MGEENPQKTPKHDFIVKQGATFNRVIKFRDKDTGLLQSLDSLDSALLYAKPEGLAAVTVMTGGPGDKFITIDKPNKLIRIYIADSITDTFTWPEAEYRFEITDASGDTFRRLRGKLKLEAKVV